MNTQLQAVEQAVWTLMLPKAAQQLLTDGTHFQHVRDLYLPDLSHAVLANNLLATLAVQPHRSLTQVEAFFAYFERALGPRQPGGTSLFDRAFGLSIPIDVPKMQQMNRIIQGNPVLTGLDVKLTIRVLQELQESAYLTTWALTDDTYGLSNNDAWTIERHFNMWLRAVPLVLTGEL